MEISDVYKESCSMFSHYSRSSLMIRIAAIAQGIVVLSAAGYLYRNGEFDHAAISSMFGILFTLILRFLHINYQHKCGVVANVAIEIEGLIENETARLMTIYEEDHSRKNKTLFGEVFVINGFFYFMALSFFVLFGAAVYAR